MVNQTLVWPTVVLAAMVLVLNSSICLAQQCTIDWTAQYDPRNPNQDRDETNGPVPSFDADDVIGYSIDGNRVDEDEATIHSRRFSGRFVCYSAKTQLAQRIPLAAIALDLRYDCNRNGGRHCASTPSASANFRGLESRMLFVLSCPIRSSQEYLKYFQHSYCREMAIWGH